MFDKGYEIVWVGHCRARCQRIPDLPVAEFYKDKFVDEITGNKFFFWNVVPLALTDEKIDDALPKDWRDKRYMGFKKFNDLKNWLQFS